MIPLDSLYFGIVEDVNDPLFLGRLKVRIFGLHTEDKNKIRTEDLPWCDIMMPVPHPFVSGIGLAPTGIVNGTMVSLIPKDKNFLQEWFVLFSVGGMREVYKSSTSGFNDPSGEYPKNTTNHDVNVVARGKTGAIISDISNDGVTQLKGYGAATDKYKNQIVDEVEKTPDLGGEEVKKDYSKTPWMPFALGEVGVNEKQNPAKIKEYHTYGGGSSKWGGETPWCSSFANWCFYKAGLKGSRNPMAKSWLKWGKSLPIDKNIPYGAIIVMQGSRGASSGHVCFATGVSNGRVQTVGGNQSPKKFDNGGEVTKSSIPLSLVIGVRWPSD